jgi:coenzyme F420-dependent glucose-6-phosphate dehydrogenase
MLEIGYALSSEEFPPNDLVHYAQRAEEMGFSFALISDHYHPWIDRRGIVPSRGASSVPSCRSRSGSP